MADGTHDFIMNRRGQFRLQCGKDGIGRGQNPLRHIGHDKVNGITRKIRFRTRHNKGFGGCGPDGKGKFPVAHIAENESRLQNKDNEPVDNGFIDSNNHRRTS